MYDLAFRDRRFVRPTNFTERLRGETKAQDVRGERRQDVQQTDASSRWERGCYNDDESGTVDGHRTQGIGPTEGPGTKRGGGRRRTIDAYKNRRGLHTGDH